MSVPANFKAAISAHSLTVGRWLEIEGIPYAYGNFFNSSSFFSARSALLRFLGVQPQLMAIPRSLDQTVDTLEGGALTVGSADFTFSDDDAQPTAWTGVGKPLTGGQLTLDGDHSAAATTITVFGPLATYAALGNYVNGGYIYIGTETIKIGTISGQTFTGCTRGMFRSRPQAFGSGTPVFFQAYTMANRRCWYNEIAVDNSLAVTTIAALIAAADPDRCVRFAGTCRNFILKDNDMGPFVLSVESMDRELDRNCFRTLREFKLGTAIMDAEGKNGDRQCPGFDGFTSSTYRSNNFLYGFDELDFPTVPERVMLKIDNEIFDAARITPAVVGGKVIRLDRRGLFGTEVVAHDEGASVQEVVIVSRYDATSQPTSKFSSVPTAGAPLQPDHPLMIVLQMLLSTGAGTNFVGGKRNYDVLPEGWGMAIDVSRVDVAGIEAAAMEEPALKFGGIQDSPENFAAWMRNFLRMCGYYYTINIGDIFKIHRLRPPLPDVSTTAINNGKRIRTFFPKWEANWSGAIREVVFKFGWDINSRTFRRIVVLISDDGDVYSKGLARSITLESKFLYDGTGIPGQVTNEKFDVKEWLKQRTDFYRARYGIPPPILHERVDYSMLDIEIGDLVNVTHTNLPDVARGLRGLTASVGEIIGKSIDDTSKTIDLTILMTGWTLGRYRFIAPSLKILSAEDDTIFHCASNQFTEPVGPFAGGTQYDNELEKSNGAIVIPFALGVAVWVWTENFGFHQGATVASYSGYVGGEIIISLTPDGGSWDPVFGGNPGDSAPCFLTFQGFAAEDGLLAGGEIITATYAFGDDGTIIDPANRYFPL